MSASILLIGDYPLLLQTRAAILGEWNSSIASTATAPNVLKGTVYDLLILCQTVPNELARRFIDLACEANPEIKVLAFAKLGQVRHLGDAIKHHIVFGDPLLLKETVAKLLRSSQSGCAGGKGLFEVITEIS